MDKIIIYPAEELGFPLYEAPMSKQAKIVRQLMGEYYIEIPFNTTQPIPFTAGCYIKYNGFEFFLKKDAFPEPIVGVDGYKYVLKFYAPQHHLERCMCKWNVGSNSEVTFTLTTTLDEFAKLLVDNMNKFQNATNAGFYWSYANSNSIDTREVTFDGISCWEAMQRIAEAFGVEWWVNEVDIVTGDNELQINFGKLAEGPYEEIREGEVVTRFPASKRGEDENYGTRFYIYGSAKNIPDDYYENVTGGVTNHISEKRLHLPGGKEYIDVLNGDIVDTLPNGRIIERVIILEDVFPRNTSTISAIEEREEEVIEGRKDKIYSISSVDSEFTGADEQVLSSLGITFTSGALSGSSFDVRWNKPFEQKFHIQPKVEGTGGSEQMVIPNEYLRPEVGDTFVLTGIKLSKDKVTKAEDELEEQGVAKAKEYGSDTNVYDCKTDPVYCQNNKKNYRVGQRVKLMGGTFGEEGRMSRIQGFEKALWNEYDAIYNVGDNTAYSRVKAVAKSYANNSGRIVRQETTRWENRAKALALSAGNADVTNQVNALIGNDQGMSAREIANDAISKKTTTLEDAATSQDDDGLVTAKDAVTYFASKSYVNRIDGEIAGIEANMSSLEDDIKNVENTLGTLNTTITQVSKKADNAVSTAESATTKADEAKTTATEAKTTANSVSAQMSGVLTQVQNNTTQIGIIAKDYLRKDQAADFATDLTGVVEATAEEFVYRPSAGEKSIRDKSAVIRRIKGNSVVWEQKLKSPSDENANWQGYTSSMLTTEIQGREMRCTLTGASVATNPYQVGITGILPSGSVAGHKYMFYAWVKVSYLNNSLGNSFTFEHDWNTWTLYPAISEVDKWTFISRIWESPQNNNRTSTIRPPWAYTSANGAKAGDWYAIKDAMLFDLTAMFGAGNEPATVEEFRKVYNEAYYPYCQPELRGVKTGAIKTVGFNLFDGECARVIGGMTYIVSNYAAAYYSETKNGAQTAVLIKDGVYTPECSGYLHLTGTADATPCVHFQHSGVMDGECAPYVEHTLNLPEILKLFPINGMHGLRNTYHDVYDEINIDNYIKRLEIVDLGSLWWNSDSSRQCFHAPLNTHKVRGIALCTRYTCSTLGGISDKQLSTHNYYGSDRIFIKDVDFDNPTDFMASLQGVYLVYELNDPIITPLSEPITLDYYCEDWGSEEAVPASSASAPFRADIVYQFNAEGRIRDNSRNIDKLEKIVAPLKVIPSNTPLATQGFVLSHIPTRVATATERHKMYEGQTMLIALSPNVMYDWTIGDSLDDVIGIPQLYIDTETIGTYDHKWMVRVASDTSNKVSIPFDVLWKDGIAPSWSSWCICEITFSTDAKGLFTLGEWKIYR